MLVSALSSTGCALRLTEFAAISTKSNMLNADSEQGVQVRGLDCVPVILVHWGEPSLKAAIDKAIESAGPGYDALIDGAVYHRYEYVFFGRDCWEVEGTAVSRGGTTKATAEL
jgi:hypothetical protein